MDRRASAGPRLEWGARCLGAALAVSVAAAAAADTGRWRIAGGSGSASASLLSSNSLLIGNRQLEYHPMLSLSCTAGGDWSQSVRLRGQVGSGAVPVTVQIDGKSATETWTAGTRGGSLTRGGRDGIARLAKGDRLSLSWKNGLFSGAGQAVFSLSGIDDVLTELSQACGG